LGREEYRIGHIDPEAIPVTTFTRHWYDGHRELAQEI
jgi:hypothetical protein